MTEKTKMTDDDAFDRDLAALLTDAGADTAPLSQAVLSRLAAQTTQSGRRPLGDILVAPLPLGAGFAALLAAAAATGYALMPVSGWEDPMLMLALGELLIGGF